jgi:hypothetical protein
MADRVILAGYGIFLAILVAIYIKVVIEVLF